MKVKREDHPWGVVLSIQPFRTPQFQAAKIVAEVRMGSGPNPEVKVWFSGVPATTPITKTDARVWMEAYRAVLSESQQVSDTMKKASKTSKKKSTKKKPSKKGK